MLIFQVNTSKLLHFPETRQLPERIIQKNTAEGEK